MTRLKANTFIDVPTFFLTKDFYANTCRIDAFVISSALLLTNESAKQKQNFQLKSA